jgi:hypothetical protein
MSTFGESSSCPEAWSPSLPSSLLSPEPSSFELLDSSSSVEDSGEAAPFPLSLHQLAKRGKETDVRKIKGQKFCELAVANRTV